MRNASQQKIAADLKQSIMNDGIQKVVMGALFYFEDKVLLLRRVSDDFMGGLVELPSGTVDAHEGFLDALIRECKEETGLNVTSIESYIGCFDYISGSGKRTRQLNFAVLSDSSDVTLAPQEHDAYFMVSPFSNEFKELNISPQTRKIIHDFFQSKPGKTNPSHDLATAATPTD